VPDDAAPFFNAMSLACVVDDRADPPVPYGEETVLFGRRVGAQQARGHIRLAVALTERLSGNVESALANIDAALAGFRMLGDRYGEAYALAQRGHTLRWAAQYDEAEHHLQRSEILRRDLQDQRAVALSLSGRAVNAASAGAADLARALGQEAVMMMERSGDAAGMVLANINLGVTELVLADLSAALIRLNRGAEFFPNPGGHRTMGWVHLLRAHILRQLGDFDRSTTAAATAEMIFSQLDERRGLAAVQRACKVGVLSLPA
jgi:tetratricopeptide (TPR) repeat protein